MILDIMAICIILIFLINERVDRFDTSQCVANAATKEVIDSVKVMVGSIPTMMIPFWQSDLDNLLAVVAVMMALDFIGFITEVIWRVYLAMYTEYTGDAELPY